MKRVPYEELISGSSSLARWFRIVGLPLAILGAGPLAATEVRHFASSNLVTSAVADVVYFSHGAFGLAHGHVPYSIHFMTYPDQNLRYLYPPLTLLISLPPVLAGSNYATAFSVEVLLLVAVGAWLLGAAGRRWGSPFPVGLAALVLLLATGPVLLTRLDAIQGLMVAGAALALMGRRRVIAVLLVSLAVLIKETAVLAAVPVALWCLFPDPEAQPSGKEDGPGRFGTATRLPHLRGFRVVVQGWGDRLGTRQRPSRAGD